MLKPYVMGHEGDVQINDGSIKICNSILSNRSDPTGIVNRGKISMAVMDIRSLQNQPFKVSLQFIESKT